MGARRPERRGTTATVPEEAIHVNGTCHHGLLANAAAGFAHERGGQGSAELWKEAIA